MDKTAKRFFLLLLLCSGGHLPGATQYAVTDLGTLGGATSSANDVNDHGEVVGTADLPYALHHAFLYSGGHMIDLGSFGGSSIAYAINNQMQVVGVASEANGNGSHAFAYSGGSMSQICSRTSQANDINDSGIVIGMQGTGDMTSSAFLHTIGTTNLNFLTSADCGVCINANGEVGIWVFEGGWRHAYYVSGSTRTYLRLTGYVNTLPTAINNKGQVVGNGSDYNQNTRGFFYSNGTTVAIGTFGGVNSIASDINDNGEIVGWANTANGERRAFFLANGTMVDLNTRIPGSGWYLESAAGINTSGQIVGTGYNPAGQKHAYLLTPISPNPAKLHLHREGTNLALTVQGSASFRYLIQRASSPKSTDWITVNDLVLPFSTHTLTGISFAQTNNAFYRAIGLP